MEDSRADRLEDKLDKVMDIVTGIAVSMAKDEAEHKALSQRVSNVEKDLKPVKEHVIRMEAAGKVTLKALGIVSILGAIIGSILQIFRPLR